MKKKILAAVLSAAMIVSSSSVALAAGTGASPAGASGRTVSVKKIKDAGLTKAIQEKKSGVVQKKDNAFKVYSENDVVRVSIILKKAPTIAKYSTTDIAQNSAAMKYRDGLRADQDKVVAKIEKVLGKKLRVSWNLTLAANIVSASVRFGDIAAIEKVDGVKSVILERKYEPADFPALEKTKKADPAMATSGDMIGSGVAWADGYTGAGSRVAIIDTGIDDDHQSFDAGAFDYSLDQNADALGEDPAAYLESLNLLDEEEISGVLDKLNVYEIDPSVTAADLYRNDKIAFGYSYVSQNLDITHENDGAGEHGSHVAGIAAANTYVPDGDSYINALDNVYVQGVAPDAQILAMKVFGKSADGSDLDDGAYDSDYMAAIEDAIILGADAVNLSLGSVVPGFETEYEYDYQDIMDSLEETDTLMVTSAGNNADVGANSYYGGDYGVGTYADDNSFNTMGSPGSYTNSFAIASVDNTGMTGAYLLSGEDIIFFTESIAHQDPISSLVSEDPYDYILIDGFGLPAQIDAVKDIINGKIAMISRGETTFVEKCNLAAEAGAIAVVIYNNQPGTLSMALDDYTGTAPAIFITQENGEKLKTNAGDPSSVTYTTEDGEATLNYYLGTLSIPGGVAVEQGEPEYYTMSDFSSMGTPTSLILKPEITAPGGNIYSVMGAHQGMHTDEDTGEQTLTGLIGDSTTYENMSGTSMAAPQVTGMAALVAQHIRENGLAEQEGITVRALAQSLLMATAIPATDSYGDYYSVMKQGAGIANVGNAVNAASYIIMGEDATSAFADGKVKAELGDDPERTGEYSYSFTVYNMSDEDLTYALGTDLCMQCPAPVQNGPVFVMPDTIALFDYTQSYLVDGAEAEEVTVPAHGSAKVEVKLVLGETDRAYLEYYYENGSYVSGYTNLEPAVDDEDAYLDVPYSIPVLAYYGNYSDATMYDMGSLNEYLYDPDMRVPYSYVTYEQYEIPYYANFMETQYVDLEDPTYEYDQDLYISNPYSGEDENALDRQAINSESIMLGYSTRNIDTASIYTNVILDAEGKVVSVGDIQRDVYPAFYYPTYGLWLEASDDGLYLYGATYTGIDKTAGELGFEEGDTFTAAAVAIPEYYTKGVDVDQDTIAKWLEDGTLGKGVLKETTFVVDDTYPELVDEEAVVTADDETARTITLSGQDNQYLAYAAVLSYNEGTEYELLASQVPAQTEQGEEVPCEFSFDLADIGATASDAEAYIIVLADYAGNESMYLVSTEAADFSIPESISVVAGETAEIKVEPAEMASELTWTVEDETIATVDENGVVTGLKAGTTTVTASTEDGTSETCTVHVLFTDVTNEEDWYFVPVYWALENGITTGTTPTEFKPANKCTRAAVVTFLYRLAGEPEVTSENPFRDVKPDKYYYNAVLWAYENGITTGMASDPTKFAPSNPCTRAAVVTFLHRFAGEPEPTIENPFTDVKESSYYYNSVRWAFENGITTGLANDPTRFAPSNTCVRRQVVTFLYRAFGDE